MDALSPEAEAVGAVNTIVNRNGTLTGYNTDIAGVMSPLEPYKSMVDSHPAAIFGNGGAAMAAIEALCSHFTPSIISLFVRNTVKGDEIRRKFQHRYPQRRFSVHQPDDYPAIEKSRLVINATPIGTKGCDSRHNNCIVPPETDVFHSNQVIFDMVYNPTETPLLKMARKAGSATIPGIDMLLSQAAHSFSIWTDREMPVCPIRKKLLELIESET